MAFPRPLHSGRPGPSALDNNLSSKLDTRTRERLRIYQPPHTPSAISPLNLSTASLTSETTDETVIRSRKRLRRDSTTFDRTTPYSASANGWADLASGQSSTTSPAPFVNTKYLLAGGLDTPSAAAASAFEPEDDDYTRSRAVYRRGGIGAGIDRATLQDGYFPYVPAALSRESNGRSRVYVTPAAQDGWGYAVFNVLGGVAGKVWDFCTGSAFHGFYAGGGNNYQVRSSTQSPHDESSIRQYLVEGDDTSPLDGREFTPILGRLPDEDFIPDYISRDHCTPPRPAKKLQRIKGEGGLRSSWVLVSSTPKSRGTSPSRFSARKLPAASNPDRRLSTATARSVAPKAGLRPTLPASRPSLTSFAGSPALHPSRPASFASPRSPGGKGTPVKSTKSLSPEAKQYAAKVRKREVEDDASIKRLNRQLKAMIREGKEALGTKFDVDDEMDGVVDEGYAEGDYFGAKNPWVMES
ncbi:hypothetical protein MMC16_006030 [Acarospora aff. strigata]|nr:hypothetical protein [Acarospora aff. strigata]